MQVSKKTVNRLGFSFTVLLILYALSFASVAAQPKKGKGATTPEKISKSPVNPLNAELIAAVKAENVEQVKILLARGADPDAENRENEFRVPALVEILSHGSDEKAEREIAEALIGAGADVNKDGSTGFTPLMVVSDLAVVKLLLERKADVNLSTYNSQHSTPLHEAIWKPQVASLLIAAGAGLDARNNDGNTPLLEAVLRIARNVDENGEVESGGEAEKDLKACLETVSLLLKAGADRSVKNADGQTALSVARNSKNRKLIEMLEKAPAK